MLEYMLCRRRWAFLDHPAYIVLDEAHLYTVRLPQNHAASPPRQDAVRSPRNRSSTRNLRTLVAQERSPEVCCYRFSSRFLIEIVEGGQRTAAASRELNPLDLGQTTGTFRT